MSKTLGAGSMGKVKLGISGITGEKVAIKIIPRFTSTAGANRPPPSSTNGNASGSEKKDKEYVKPTASFLAKAAAKDASKEVRTMREGSLCLLLHHPYVCGMKQMILYPNHYYMVTEYVNGGQMLDYIISHGRLRERSARKFARQIGSALEYCHANSIVHRDLKIENILISKTGNIKIIDFGLSNLYTPAGHLNTFCGSLYFAAPELLNAKLYTGPEVDVWSFGIVLYVLVCGKVPFDDQSMPALHAKIKRGQVEYPTWLSAECKHILSRMLVTVPSQRATLTEVLNHPWMTKGFSGPPSPHLPPRLPLKVEDLSRDVIKGMVGFEFGTDAEIEENLVEVLTSDLYRAAVRSWEAKRLTPGADGDPDNEKSASERPAMRVDGKDMKGIGRSPTSKRFSGLGFYGKKLAGGINAAFSGSGGKTDSDAGDASSNGSTSTLIGGIRPDQLDPTRGFHPLISIYYLVREKIEREKIWGPGVFASSTLSLTGPPPPPAPVSAYQAGAGSVTVPPRASDITKPPTSAAAALEAEVLASPRPTTVPPVPMTPQPRARATGDEIPQHPSTAPPVVRESAAGAGGFRSGFSGKRNSMHETSRPLSAFEPPVSPTPNKRQTVHQIGDTGVIGSGNDDSPLSSPSAQGGGGFARRFGSLLGRSSPEGGYKGHRQRASISGIAHKASNKTTVSALPQVSEGTASIPTTGSDVPLASPSDGKTVQRSSTVGELSPSRHQRGLSMGASPTSGTASMGRQAGAQVAERRRQISLGAQPAGSGRPAAGLTPAPFDERAEEEELALPDDEAGVPGTPNHQQDVGFIGRTASTSGGAGSGGGDGAKPVWLKGLFSVSTTSTKSIATIKKDLVTVLDRLGVQYRDVKNGFECAHVPSIDLSSVGSSRKAAAGEKDGKSTIRRRASRLLLSSSKDANSGGGGDDSSQISLPGVGERGTGGGRSSTSFTVLPPMSPTEGLAPSTPMSPNPMSPGGQQKFPASSGTGGGGEGVAAISSDLIVRFEVFVVRMPLLPGIHGLQFRRIAGNAWQYQMLARRVLSELKL
ncbi:Pkinase-domain-containing protein [Meredithblackwellia eburnea MCA 4105]